MASSNQPAPAGESRDVQRRDELDDPQAGQIIRQEFGATQISQSGETSAIVLAEREKAMIAALFITAAGRPRNIEAFRTKLMADCARPGFAEIAKYHKPQKRWDPVKKQQVDDPITGWSIRFAESVMRNYGNVYNDAKITFEDSQKRIVRFMCIDLENNVPMSAEIQLNKTVERKGFIKNGKLEPPGGREVLGQRENTYGDTIFIVRATEDELAMKQASAWSKFIRNVIRFTPGDIIEEAELAIEATLKGQTKEASIARMVQGFDRLKISFMDLQMYLGKPLSEITSDDMTELRGVYTLMKEGTERWDTILAAKQPAGTSAAAEQIAKDKIAKAEKDLAQAKADAAAKTVDTTTSKPEEKPPIADSKPADAPKEAAPATDTKPEPKPAETAPKAQEQPAESKPADTKPPEPPPASGRPRFGSKARPPVTDKW